MIPNRRSILSLATLLAGLALTGCDYAVRAPFENSEPTTSNFFQTSRGAPCPAARSRTVLIDATHDGGVWWYPQYEGTGFDPSVSHQGSKLANHLRSQGFTVTELGRSAKMSQDSLLTYAVVIRASYYADVTHPGITADDLAAYRAFVACPRTLLLLGEYQRAGSSDILADSLGIPLRGANTGSITTFAAHPITAGLIPMPYIAGSYLANETNPSIQVLGRLIGGEAAMGVLAIGSAKVFFIGDTNGIEQVPQPLIANLIAWGF